MNEELIKELIEMLDSEACYDTHGCDLHLLTNIPDAKLIGITESTCGHDGLMLVYEDNIPSIVANHNYPIVEVTIIDNLNDRDALQSTVSDDIDLLFLSDDSMDDCIVGITKPNKFFDRTTVVYSTSKLIEVLMGEGMEYEDAMEHFSYNVSGGWLGEQTPIFIQ